MQSKQTHAPTTPSHVDDPCDSWSPLGKIAQRIVHEYARDIPHNRDDDDAEFARTFTRFGG